MKRKCILSIFLLPVLLFSIVLKVYDVGGQPLRIGETDRGIFIMDSLKGSIHFIHGDKKDLLHKFLFPLWAETLGNYLYVTDVKRGCVYKVDLSSFNIVSKVHVKRPEMIKIYKGRIYVSSNDEVNELDKNLRILRNWKFCAKSVYFYFYEDLLIHMNYWKTKDCPDVTVIDLKKGKVVKNLYLGFERPLRFLSIYDKWVFLDYKTGDIAFVRNFHIIKRIDLPAYSYDVIYYENKIVVSNLFEKSLYVVDPTLYRVSKMQLNCQVGDLEAFNDHLFLSCMFDNYVCSMKNWKLEWKIPCEYPIMMAKDSKGLYLLCTDEGKVKFIDMGGKIKRKEGS